MVDWVEGKHAGYRAKLAPGVELSVQWDATRSKESDLPPWLVNVMGCTLKRRFEDQDEAKAAAISAARELLTKALNALQ